MFRKKRERLWIDIVVAVLIVIVLFFVSDLGSVFTFKQMPDERDKVISADNLEVEDPAEITTPVPKDLTPEQKWIKVHANMGENVPRGTTVIKTKEVRKYNTGKKRSKMNVAGGELQTK